MLPRIILLGFFMSVNFKKVRFGCYALGKIMGLDRDEKLNTKELKILASLENKLDSLTEEELIIHEIFSKRKKEAEKSLSASCITYLREELFIFHTYGERIRPSADPEKDSNLKLSKGSLAELSAIHELAGIDGHNYRKNVKKYKNFWITGIPDVNYKKRLGDRTVIDVKSSWDLYSFMKNIPKGINHMHDFQVQGYISLTNADVGEVCHILVSAPDEIIERQVEKFRLKHSFNTPEQQKEAEDLIRKSMRFDDIPLEERIIRFKVERNDEQQKMLFDRVDLCRDWLVNYQKSHQNLFKKK